MRIVFLVDLGRILLENLRHQLKVLCRLNHQLARVSLGDLHVPLEHIVVLEADIQGSNGHGLRDSAEVENALLFETREVVDAIVGAGQRIQYHF